MRLRRRSHEAETGRALVETLRELARPGGFDSRARHLRTAAVHLGTLARYQRHGARDYEQAAELVRFLADLEGVAASGLETAVAARGPDNRWLPAWSLRRLLMTDAPGVIETLSREERQDLRGVLITQLYPFVVRHAGPTTGEIVFLVGLTYQGAEHGHSGHWWWP